MSRTENYELNTPVGSEILSVMTGLNPNFETIDTVMKANEVRSNEAKDKADVNEQNIATTLGRVTTAEGKITNLENNLETTNTNVTGLTSRMDSAESNIISANNRIHENSTQIAQINEVLANKSGNIIGNPTSLTVGQNFICPSDGYVEAEVSDINGTVRVDCPPLNGIVQAMGTYHRDCTKVNKGMVLYYGETVTNGSAKFYPLSTN